MARATYEILWHTQLIPKSETRIINIQTKGGGQRGTHISVSYSSLQVRAPDDEPLGSLRTSRCCVVPPSCFLELPKLATAATSSSTPCRLHATAGALPSPFHINIHRAATLLCYPSFKILELFCRRIERFSKVHVVPLDIGSGEGMIEGPAGHRVPPPAVDPPIGVVVRLRRSPPPNWGGRELPYRELTPRLGSPDRSKPIGGPNWGVDSRRGRPRPP
ncbi:hypothetical protein CRG98_033339 [Punica granatum]|uniref:Uncharacterized protein n=1 Tax=Punica granatum TaxID=22663 RepID=A0A2I0IQJ3_PUNGR|nr:hypothetical protein CRG98_033339 [Punica granatum]